MQAFRTGPHVIVKQKVSASAHTGNQTSSQGYCIRRCRVTASAHTGNQTLFFSYHCIHSACFHSTRLYDAALRISVRPTKHTLAASFPMQYYYYHALSLFFVSRCLHSSSVGRAGAEWCLRCLQIHIVLIFTSHLPGT